MKKVIFDFNEIASIEDFYKVATSKLLLPDYFGNNLDALWDIINGVLPVPLSIKFINLSLQQLDEFSDLISLMLDAEMLLGADFIFDFYVEK